MSGVQKMIVALVAVVLLIGGSFAYSVYVTNRAAEDGAKAMSKAMEDQKEMQRQLMQQMQRR
ncbi:hypothetical protein [Magnetospirillum sp. 15-1]|uniref:hypothetical protein n=1 Tax=Magnetospirillum sp. 15-1 TaxID=1979370 RepID=UPI000BBBE2AA|nr:hypothetical protein [Magnetospirillum sp. 15-1]